MLDIIKNGADTSILKMTISYVMKNELDRSNIFGTALRQRQFIDSFNDDLVGYCSNLAANGCLYTVPH